MNKQELINKLPVKWSEITLNQYINLVNDLPIYDAEGMDFVEYKKLLANIFFFHFTGKYMYEVNLNASEVLQVISKLDAFEAEADAPKMDLSNKIKSIETITYDELMLLIKLQQENSLKVYPQMINTMLLEQIDNIGDNMDMATANSFFLQLQQGLETYLSNSQRSLMKKIL